MVLYTRVPGQASERTSVAQSPAFMASAVRPGSCCLLLADFFLAQRAPENFADHALWQIGSEFYFAGNLVRYESVTEVGKKFFRRGGLTHPPTLPEIYKR